MLGLLFLLSITPVVAVLITHLFKTHRGSLRSLLKGHEPLVEVWPNPFDTTAWKLIGAFLGTQLALVRDVPGKTSYSPVTDGREAVEPTPHVRLVGLARHFHFVLETFASLCSTLPVDFSSAVQYFYVVYLTKTLRVLRRRAHKYAKD
ncbi:hypothetical protein PybrP1_000725 [[Pythium] brassicae (nom. inval.)]|nr:hypothetical protein PybrP1_000725 [[Pythium] brassicae (nom. inval.)]